MESVLSPSSAAKLCRLSTDLFLITFDSFLSNVQPIKSESVIELGVSAEQCKLSGSSSMLDSGIFAGGEESSKEFLGSVADGS